MRDFLVILHDAVAIGLKLDPSGAGHFFVDHEAKHKRDIGLESGERSSIWVLVKYEARL